ncbi:hypothetical protein KNE206_43590 [Kitasatospora sp. NE20-6]
MHVVAVEDLRNDTPLGGHPPAASAQSLQQVTHIGSPIQADGGCPDFTSGFLDPTCYGADALLDLDSVHCRIGSSDGKGQKSPVRQEWVT